MSLRTLALCMPLLLAAGAAGGEPPAARAAAGPPAPDRAAAPPPAPGDQLMSGMSVVGNDDAPKSLVIVPWKSSLLADTLDVSRGLDAGREPVDRDVFGRELDYYEIRAGSTGAAGSP
jgi:hypothetical protein